ncbi:paramyosin-like isoform X3 [Centruroides vittatus]|uniref:paramyosin-like isoform X3 n=1 Tax=Centruroides vittatus TaxID=120091 RepID=UPI0035108117
MVVTEREPSPQQGPSPSLSDRNLKEGIDGLSPVPPSHSSAEDRASSGLGSCTDQELSDCPVTPQTPPAFLTFLQPFPSECETPPATTPFPERLESREEEVEGLTKEDGAARQSVQEDNSEEQKGEDSITCPEEKSENERIEKGGDECDVETDSLTILAEKEEGKLTGENVTERSEIEKNTEEIPVGEYNESLIVKESYLDKPETEECVEEKEEGCVEPLQKTETVLEETELTNTCVQSIVDENITKESWEENIVIETVKESVVKESVEEKIIKQTVEESTAKQTAEESVVKEKVEEISVNQLWSLWSSSAPKVEEKQEEEEKQDESPSAGQSGDETREGNEKESQEQPEVVQQKSIEDDLNDTRMKLSDAERRMHEMEVEIKRLENEREELSSAYREAEALRKQEEAKAMRLTAELTQVRHEYEKRLIAKEEEIESLRKQMQIEIEQLSQRVAEAEAKVKTEVARIKKKMQVQITELEMSLDVANKQNIDLQKTIKKQSLQITELQAHYDEIHRQLQQTVDQLGVSQRRCQALQAELEETRVNLEQALRARRMVEQQIEEVTSRINELTTINVNLTSAKSKLEAEFMSLQSDYDEINKELRISDERYNRVQIELKSTKDVLIEEQERLVKIEQIKKSLEMEVHNLTVRIEEVEANALAGGKRVVSKLESRIRDIEIELEEEKRRHVETQKVLRKKEYRIKELIVQAEEDHQAITVLNDSVDKLSEKCKMYKRQLVEQEGMSQQNLTRVRRFQRELEAAEERADQAESNLSLIRAKHRSWVTTSQIPGGLKQVIVTEETSSTTSQY